MKLNLHGLKATEQRIQAAFRKTAETLDQQFATEIESAQWQWPRQTERRSGEVVFSPRNIVDRGDLRDSQTLSFPDPDTAQYHWSVPYAFYVHEGVTLENGTVLPGRRWTEAATRSLDIPQTFKDNY